MKKKPESKLITQTNNNDYSERNHYYIATNCNQCCCNFCTGFACPWVGEHERKYTSLGNKSMSNRCHVCHKHNFTRIYDCDFYTYYRRRKFFLPKKYIKRKTQLEIMNEKLALILKKLDGN